MKYEEWIQYERARIEEQKHRISDRLRHKEKQKRTKRESNSSNPSYKGPIPPSSPPLPT